ncbi:MAG: hypothetical protein J6W66_09030 [Lachnospiraceae bacterium]|nr:hypothetical protein [Lachnospiraceae bacterium]MBP5733947.1 hypothetical protein [Lachnospiraceae bacterium]
MNRDWKERVKKAREYQRKAILELLPEGMEEHLNVIGRELRLMAEEALGSAVTCCLRGDKEDNGESDRVKKVEIR